MHEPKTPYVEYCPVTVRLKLEFRACYGMGFEPGGEARVAPKYQKKIITKNNSLLELYPPCGTGRTAPSVVLVTASASIRAAKYLLMKERPAVTAIASSTTHAVETVVTAAHSAGSQLTVSVQNAQP